MRLSIAPKERRFRNPLVEDDIFPFFVCIAILISFLLIFHRKVRDSQVKTEAHRPIFFLLCQFILVGYSGVAPLPLSYHHIDPQAPLSFPLPLPPKLT